jgi:DNA-binding MarR family transcriptional regulator
MADLAEQLSVTPRNVTALVDGLEVERLVRRVPHATDRRVTLVELTGNADLVEAQFMSYQASIESLLMALDEADQQTLHRVLETLRDRMHVEAGWSTAGEEATDA